MLDGAFLLMIFPVSRSACSVNRLCYRIVGAFVTRIHISTIPCEYQSFFADACGDTNAQAFAEPSPPGDGTDTAIAYADSFLICKAKVPVRMD